MGHTSSYSMVTGITPLQAYIVPHSMNYDIELVEALGYKLQMFGIPISSATHIFCDNKAVTNNYSNPTSTLKKKHHLIAYHRNREAVAAGTCSITKEDTETNLSDWFTKKLPRALQARRLARQVYILVLCNRQGAVVSVVVLFTGVWVFVIIVVASVNGHVADNRVRTRSMVARGTPKGMSDPLVR
jgi:hypothetical protein